ncbi:hypothetical protein, partial [Leeuwenhoekiella parthenopeia]
MKNKFFLLLFFCLDTKETTPKLPLLPRDCIACLNKTTLGPKTSDLIPGSRTEETRFLFLCLLLF